MFSIKAYRYQLHWLWNGPLAEQKARHVRGEPEASYLDIARWLTMWRNAPATVWLASGPVHPQRQVLKRVDEAYKHIFAKAGGFPDPRQVTLDAANGRIQLPTLGRVGLFYSRAVTGQLLNVTLTSEGGGKGARRYASIQTQTQGHEVLPAGDRTPTLGIDPGVAARAATSDCVMVQPLGAIKRQQQCLRRYKRCVARKKKCTCNRINAVKRLVAVHQRSGWQHQTSTALVGERPMIAVNSAYTSRTCRCCVHESAENRKTQAIFTSAACGHAKQADVHAAKVILDQRARTWQQTQPHQTAAGHAASAHGEAVRPGLRDSALGSLGEVGTRRRRGLRMKRQPSRARIFALQGGEDVKNAPKSRLITR